MNSFRFQQFSISQEHSALKLGTDAVILGASATFEHPKSILDIGTGTGILALMMAQKYSCPITAIDIDEGAIADATLNVCNSPWKERIAVKTQSLQDFSSTNVQFDGIICNPPFFSNGLTNKDLRKTLARHTINLTPDILFSCVEKILSPIGQVAIIVPFQEKENFISAAMQHSIMLAQYISVFPFTRDCKPNRSILIFSRIWQPLQTRTLHVREDKNIYSTEYKELTRDFYLG